VKNRWSSPVAVKLLDLLPVSRDEKIQVKLLDGSTSATREDPERPGVERGERDRGGPAAEVEHGPRPAPQLGDRAARLEVGDGPVEEEVRAEEPLLVQVARAGELALPREAARQAGDRRAHLAQLVREERVRRRAPARRSAICCPPAARPGRPAAAGRSGATLPHARAAARRAPRDEEARDPAGEVEGGILHAARCTTPLSPLQRSGERAGERGRISREVEQ